MSSKSGKIIAAVGVVVVLGVLFALPKMTDPTRATASLWQQAGLDCLNNGHTGVGLHFHPNLRILVEGVEEGIPANVGVLKSCMGEVHTHDASGKIHIESVNGSKEFYLKDFFVVFDKPLQREGYNLVMKVDDKINFELGELVLRDKQMITIEYTKK
ncbi:MAG: hypothetical protein Q7S83_00015 [bacterium]|nr:hypothetical protein [bacterium]